MTIQKHVAACRRAESASAGKQLPEHTVITGATYVHCLDVCVSLVYFFIYLITGLLDNIKH
jgi:hypothetical protein